LLPTRRPLFSDNCQHFGKFLVSVPVPVPGPDLFSKDLSNKKFVQNLDFSILEAALFPEKLALILDY
jgi:hypothetical protein